MDDVSNDETTWKFTLLQCTELLKDSSSLMIVPSTSIVEFRQKCL